MLRCSSEAPHEIIICRWGEIWVDLGVGCREEVRGDEISHFTDQSYNKLSLNGMRSFY